MVAVLASSERSAQAQTRAGGGGGDIIVFDIIDSFTDCRVMILGESVLPGVYKILIDLDGPIVFGLMWDVVGSEIGASANTSIGGQKDPVFVIQGGSAR